MSRPYRDPGRVVTKRRMEADDAIVSLEARLAPRSLFFVPRTLRQRIAQLRSSDEGSSDQLRVELAEALREAVSIVETFHHELRLLSEAYPEGPALLDSWGLAGTESAATPALNDAQHAMRALDANAVITLTGPRITARGRVRGTPALWSVHLGGEVSLGSSASVQSFTTSSHWMGTTVPKELPTIFIRGQGTADVVLKALRLRADTQVGDDLFDSAFFIEEGHAEYLRALLTPKLRDAFLTRARFGDFTFLVRDAAASIAWKTSIVERPVRSEVVAASVEILVALREALGALQLVSEPPTATEATP